MNDNCIFCRIAKKEIPTQAVYEDDLVIAFNDIEPQAPVHVLVIPKEHKDNILALEKDGTALAAHIITVAVPEIAKKLELDKKGFRLVVNTGEDGGQTVGHLHVHILGGRSLAWPPG